MPDDLQLQIPLIHQVLEAMRIPVAQPSRASRPTTSWPPSPGRRPHRGLDVFICTSDKDCRQLIDDRVRIYNLRKRQVFGRDELLEDWGITPEQVVDLQTLVGDSVDNVPGVPGIGLKTAAKLLQEFGTLDNLLANVDRRSPGPSGRRTSRPSGAHHRAAAASSSAWSTDVPLAVDWDAWRLQRDGCGRGCWSCSSEWGFHSFADQVRDASRDSAADAGESCSADGRSCSRSEPMRRRRAGSTPAPRTAPARRRSTAAGASPNRRRLAGRLSPGRYAGEVRGVLSTKLRASRSASPSTWRRPASSRCRRDIVGLAFSWQPGEAWYLPRARARGIEPVLDPATDAGAAAADPRRPGGRQGQPEHQVRPAGAARHGVELRGRGRRPDGGRLPPARRRAQP